MGQKVSIIMPTYNCGKYILESIQCVQNQTHKDWELIIVDDCSTDNTKEIVEEEQQNDERICYVLQKKNGGAAVARNTGLDHATGDYIAFLDSDDLWTEDKLEKQLDFMKKNNAVFSATGYEKMDETGDSLHEAMIPPRRTDYNKMLFLSDPIGNSTVMYDRNLLGDIRVPDIKKRNDFALWLKLLKHTDVVMGIPDVMMRYRVRKNSISANKIALAKYHWMLYRQVEELPLWKAGFALFCWAFVKGTGIGLKRKKV